MTVLKRRCSSTVFYRLSTVGSFLTLEWCSYYRNSDVTFLAFAWLDSIWRKIVQKLPSTCATRCGSGTSPKMRTLQSSLFCVVISRSMLQNCSEIRCILMEKYENIKWIYEDIYNCLDCLCITLCAVIASTVLLSCELEWHFTWTYERYCLFCWCHLVWQQFCLYSGYVLCLFAIRQCVYFHHTMEL